MDVNRSSNALRLTRSVVRGSIACALVARGTRSVAAGVFRIDELLSGRRRSVDPDLDFSDVARVAQQSLVFRALGLAVREGCVLAAGSRMTAVVRRPANHFAQLAVWQRLRLTGVLLLAAALTHRALLTAVPARSAPIVPPGVWLMAALVAVGLIVGARAVAAAWMSRKRSVD